MKTTKNGWSRFLPKPLLVVGMVSMVLALGMLTSCASFATVSGAQTPLGAFTPANVNDGRGEVIAQYTITLGLITSGYEEFLRKIDGKEVDIIDTNYFGFYRIIKAVERN
jgi:hypothetical protein